MKKIITLFVALLLVGAGCKAGPAPISPAPSSAPAPSTQAPAASMKFVDQPYYSQSYLISGAALDSEAKSALAGFQMTKTDQPDGTTLIKLKAVKSGYQDQEYTLQPGQKLYFVERFLQDDDPVKDEDRNMADDLGVVVDADGNVVQGPVSWVSD